MPRKRLVFDDDVLEDFVQRGADMDVAIGKRRAVVQDEFLRAGAGGLDFFVKLGRLPFLQAFRFARHQIGLHRESRSAADSMCLYIPSQNLKAQTVTAGKMRVKRKGREISKQTRMGVCQAIRRT